MILENKHICGCLNK